MRIGVVTTSYPRYVGDAAGHFVAGLNRYLVQQGHSVEVLAAGASSAPAFPEPFFREQRVVRLPSTLFYRGGAPDALFSGPAAVYEALRFSLRLGRCLKTRKKSYDALISHWLLPCGILAAALCGGCPHVAIAHSSDVHLLRRLRLEPLVRYVAQRARLVYTSSSLRIAGAPGVVVPMGIDAAEFAATSLEREAARQRLHVVAPTILFLGRLVPVKGVAVLLSALVGSAATPPFHLWIAGDGPLRPCLQRAAAPLKQRVRFFGEVKEAQRRELLLACDVLAVPSLTLPDGRTEGAPQVVLEGLGAGCAVVASAVGGIPELLGPAGWLVPPGDPAALRAALREALLSRRSSGIAPERTPAQAMARAARFDWSVVAPEILGPDFNVLLRR